MNSLLASYQLLGLNQASTELELRSAYKRMAMVYHPDKINQSPRRNCTGVTFIEIQQAYKNIMDEMKRQHQYQIIKDAYSKKLADLFQSETDDIQIEDRYFSRQQKRMKEKLSSIQETLDRWKKNRQEDDSSTNLFSPFSSREEVIGNAWKQDIGFQGFQSRMNEISQRIKKKINIFKIIEDDEF